VVVLKIPGTTATMGYVVATIFCVFDTFTAGRGEKLSPVHSIGLNWHVKRTLNTGSDLSNREGQIERSIWENSNARVDQAATRSIACQDKKI
jgi:hypothetical protein